jgi:hypothetical protein
MKGVIYNVQALKLNSVLNISIKHNNEKYYQLKVEYLSYCYYILYNICIFDNYIKAVLHQKIYVSILFLENFNVKKTLL